MQNFYLKPSIKIEPLICRWYAWSHLISPLTAACNIVERHLKIMKSYVQNPKIHAQAVKDPKLLGGPFIDLQGRQTDEITALIQQTNKDCADLIGLHEAYKNMNLALQKEAQGDSLEVHYSRIPEPLKGFVELVYNLNSHPSARLLEALIYKKYYSTNHQSICISETVSDIRKFSWGTPYLEQEHEVHLDIPFSDKRLDALYKMKETPDNLAQVLEILEIPQGKLPLFQSFFTTNPPRLPDDRNYNQDGIRIRYFGHACILIQTKSVSILIDPVISYPLNNTEIPRYTFADLPERIDYVLITHSHQDHLMFEMLLQLRHKIGCIVFPANNNGALEDPSIKLVLQHIGFNSLIELKEMESISIPEGEITGIPFFGEHSDLNIQSKLSYCIQVKDSKFLFAADSNNLEPALYDHIFASIGKMDMLFLGMECEGAPLTWTYGPLLSTPLKRSYDNNRTLSGSNFEKAWIIAEKSKCKHAYVYAMGQEPWLSYVMALKYAEDSPQIVESDKFVAMCKSKGIESERLFGKKEWII